MFNKTIHNIFFKSWIWVIRATCILFLVVQSHTISTVFTLYVVALMLVIRYPLELSRKFRLANRDLQKVVTWTVMALIVAFVAYALSVIIDTSEINDKLFNFLVICGETTLLMLSTYLMVTFVNWLTNRKKSKVKNKVVVINKKIT